MSEKRGSLYLISGLIIGLAIGLLISLVILPVRYTDTEPSTLNAQDRAAYRSLVARTYLVEADINRALTRLALLQDPAPAQDLVAQAQSLLGSNGSQQEARALALLASALTQPGVIITPLAGGSQPQPSPTATLAGGLTPEQTATPVRPTQTPFATFTPRPTSTPKPTQGPPYKLQDQTEICSSAQMTPILEVYVFDAQGNPVPGVKIEITMENTASMYFYTGFYPDISPGYADAQIAAGLTYNLRVGEGGQLITGLQAPDCQGQGTVTYPGGWKLTFQQP